MQGTFLRFDKRATSHKSPYILQGLMILKSILYSMPTVNMHIFHIERDCKKLTVSRPIDKNRFVALYISLVRVTVLPIVPTLPSVHGRSSSGSSRYCLHIQLKTWMRRVFLSFRNPITTCFLHSVFQGGYRKQKDSNSGHNNSVYKSTSHPKFR